MGGTKSVSVEHESEMRGGGYKEGPPEWHAMVGQMHTNLVGPTGFLVDSWPD